MQRILNPEMDRKVLDALAEKYHLTEKREGIHLSTLIGCLTKSYLDLQTPHELTDVEKLLFATGYGLQEVMSPKDAETPLLECDGIVYRPDMEFTLELSGVKELVEMKSTRAGVKRYQTGDLPDSWITYMKGGCYIRGVTHYNLVVIYVAERPSAAIISETILFGQDEIEENWEYLMIRKGIYEKALSHHRCPTPRKFCQGWECKYCRYSTVCDAILMVENEVWSPKED